MSKPEDQTDEELAQQLQDQEFRGGFVAEPARTARAGYAPMANYDEPGTIPVYGTAAVPSPVMVFGAHEQRLLDTYSLGRGIRVLAVVDAIILIINIIFSWLFLIVIWGPVCGYLAGSQYKLHFGYVYVAYYFLRIAGDIALCALGAWWFIIALIVDMIILRYVLLYCQLLRRCTEADIEQLTRPGSIWSQSRPYFVVF